MDTKRAPQIFHGKNIPAGSYFLQFPSELFAAINTLLSGNEAKIMLTLLGCPGDGSFCPSSEYMLRMTGIRVVVILSGAKDLYTSIKCRGSAIRALHHSTRHAHSSPFFAFILA